MPALINQISGNYVDIKLKEIYPARLSVNTKGIITDIERLKQGDFTNRYIIPGFIDAHVHVESSMLPPVEFARLAMPHGTVATISDPHEIANVLGKQGIKYMINNAKNTPLKIAFGLPSCVPATSYETAGASINADQTREIFKELGKDLYYLAEMMNYPGVLYKDEQVMEKIAIAKALQKPIDGHAPGLTGKDAKKYIAAGISTDHECFTYEEAKQKLELGMKILIREGSAAKNFDALAPLLLEEEHVDMLMFCSDDKHPNDLVVSHIDELVRRAFKLGVPWHVILQIACLNPIEHYNIPVGQLRIGEPADFIVVDQLNENLKVVETYINGILVADKGKCKLSYQASETPNNFNTQLLRATQLEVAAQSNQNKQAQVRCINALNGQLITTTTIENLPIVNNKILAQPAKDILKLVVYNRYKSSSPAVAFIKNFGLKNGAIASTVAHDSHNIIAVGSSDHAITAAINSVVKTKGGLSLVNTQTQQEKSIPLPIAGLMSHINGYQLAQDYTEIDAAAKAMGTNLTSPYMTLSFMALLVIPQLKLSDLGLFDGEKFAFTPLQLAHA